MVKNKKRRIANYTVLVVCEGVTDVNFIKHLKRLYITRHCGTSVKVKNAYGCSPENIVNVAIRAKANADFNRTVVFLDTDVEWSEELKKVAKKKKILMLGSTPCLEGLLLDILEKPIPLLSRECKTKLNDLKIGDLTNSHSLYQRHFNFDFLERRRLHITLLDSLVTNLTK